MNANRFRCPECRTRRTSFTAMIEHCRQHDHKLCGCGGYHHVHRPGSPCCDVNPMAAVHRAMRATGCSDAELEDIEMDCVWYGSGRPMLAWPGD